MRRNAHAAMRGRCPQEPKSRAGMRRAGMPRFSQSSGNTHIRDVLDPEADAFISTKVISRPRFITNACDLLVR